MKNRWKVAAVLVAAVAIATAVLSPKWASADGEQWAVVDVRTGNVTHVTASRWNTGPGYHFVEIPPGTTVTVDRTVWTREEGFNTPAAATPTPTSTGGGTIPEATAEPTATSTPGPTPTPDPEAASLQDLHDLINQLQFDNLDLENRVRELEGRVGALDGQ